MKFIKDTPAQVFSHKYCAKVLRTAFLKKKLTSGGSFYTYENSSKIFRIILAFNMKFELTKLLNFQFSDTYRDEY